MTPVRHMRHLRFLTSTPYFRGSADSPNPALPSPCKNSSLQLHTSTTTAVCLESHTKSGNCLYLLAHSGRLRYARWQNQSSEADPQRSTGGHRERRRALDAQRQVPADVRHVASSRRRRVPASLRLVDAQHRVSATADHPESDHQQGRQRRRGRSGPGRYGPARPVLRAQRRLGADVDDGRRTRGGVPVLPGKDVRRRHLLVSDAAALGGAAWNEES